MILLLFFLCILFFPPLSSVCMSSSDSLVLFHITSPLAIGRLVRVCTGLCILFVCVLCVCACLQAGGIRFWRLLTLASWQHTNECRTEELFTWEMLRHIWSWKLHFILQFTQHSSRLGMAAFTSKFPFIQKHNLLWSLLRHRQNKEIERPTA